MARFAMRLVLNGSVEARSEAEARATVRRTLAEHPPLAVGALGIEIMNASICKGCGAPESVAGSCRSHDTPVDGVSGKAPGSMAQVRFTKGTVGSRAFLTADRVQVGARVFQVGHEGFDGFVKVAGLRYCVVHDESRPGTLFEIGDMKYTTGQIVSMPDGAVFWAHVRLPPHNSKLYAQLTNALILRGA